MAAPPAAIAVGMDLLIALFTLVDEAGGSIFDEILSNGQPRVSGKKIPKNEQPTSFCGFRFQFQVG